MRTFLRSTRTAMLEHLAVFLLVSAFLLTL